VLRYGDEIGMGDDLDLPERAAARTPMQWSGERHGGFTEHSKPVVPVIEQGSYGHKHINVALQRHDPNSLLNWMERIIRMRKEMPEVGWGDFTVLRTDSPAVFALRYDWQGNAVLFLHNLEAKPCETRLAVGADREKGRKLVNVLSDDHSEAERDGRHVVALEGYGYRWYRVGGLDDVLRRDAPAR
jgi:maltose alpha-D-glucosyltransferase/alpha-amylase